MRFLNGGQLRSISGSRVKLIDYFQYGVVCYCFRMHGIYLGTSGSKNDVCNSWRACGFVCSLDCTDHPLQGGI